MVEFNQSLHPEQLDLIYPRNLLRHSSDKVGVNYTNLYRIEVDIPSSLHPWAGAIQTSAEEYKEFLRKQE